MNTPNGYIIKEIFSLTLTGLEGHICPSLVKGTGRTYMSLCCYIMVASL